MFDVKKERHFQLEEEPNRQTNTRGSLPKLRVGNPGDVYEQESDRIADSVMRADNNEDIQRRCTDCDEEKGLQPELRMQPVQEEEERNVQPKVKMEGNSFPNNIINDLNSTRGNGWPMASQTNRFMSDAFSTDFSNINIHTGQKAVQMNRQLGARAFTHGNNIYFNNGEYSPGSSHGKRLLAHELMHVIQQGQGQGLFLNGKMLSDTISGRIQCEQARRRPWSEVSGHFVIGTPPRQVRLFNHEFPQGTLLSNALQWIFDKSTARYTDFQYLDREESMRADIYQRMQERVGQPTFYQEVALVWQIRRRRFVAYTLRLSASTATDPRHRNLIFVAHTHPTPQQLQSGRGVSWRTNEPSPEDAGHIQTQQRYSIVCHLDVRDNRTPNAFIYNRSGVVQRFSGQNAFQLASTRFLELERTARTSAARVGQYRP